MDFYYKSVCADMLNSLNPPVKSYTSTLFSLDTCIYMNMKQYIIAVKSSVAQTDITLTYSFETDGILKNQFKTFNKAANTHRVPLLPAWGENDLAGFYVNESSFSIYTSDILHHFSFLLLVLRTSFQNLYANCFGATLFSAPLFFIIDLKMK